MPRDITRLSSVSEKQTTPATLNYDQQRQNALIIQFDNDLLFVQKEMAKYDEELSSATFTDAQLMQIVSNLACYYKCMIDRRKLLKDTEFDTAWDFQISEIFKKLTEYRLKLSGNYSDIKLLEYMLNQPLNQKAKVKLNGCIFYLVKFIIEPKLKRTNLADLPLEELEKLVFKLSEAYTLMDSKRREIADILPQLKPKGF